MNLEKHAIEIVKEGVKSMANGKNYLYLYSKDPGFIHSCYRQLYEDGISETFISTGENGMEHKMVKLDCVNDPIPLQLRDLIRVKPVKSQKELISEIREAYFRKGKLTMTVLCHMWPGGLNLNEHWSNSGDIRKITEAQFCTDELRFLEDVEFDHVFLKGCNAAKGENSLAQIWSKRFNCKVTGANVSTSMHNAGYQIPYGGKWLTYKKGKLV